MKKFLLLVGVMLGCAAVPASALGWHRDRSCGTHMDGFVLGDRPPYAYLVNGPWRVRISAGEAAALAPRFPPGEFGARITPQQVPCLVAAAIAYSAGNSWLHWRDGSGWSNVTAHTSGGRAFIGKFYCRSVGLSGNDVARVACRYRKGGIAGAFTISRNPYSGKEHRPPRGNTSSA